jgi:putative photosynthetic complex assembly protein
MASQASFPRLPLIGAATLIALTVLAAAAGRLTGAATPMVNGTPVAERVFRFEDRADGAVTVYDVAASRLVAVETGQNGFLRGTLRSMARAREMRGIGDAAPFHLTAWSDGRLTLDDPSTGRHVELEAFGPTNEAVFARLLTVRDGAT